MFSTKQSASSNPLLLQVARNLIERKQAELSRDPVALARLAGLEPDRWQADVLRSTAQQMILLCARQSGKSTVTSLLALHQAIYTPNSLVLLLAPALRQSQELFRKLRAAQSALLPLPVAVEEESALRTEYANGSRIICLPGKEQTIRGFSGVSLLVVDEAARVPDALYASIRPMLAVSGGKIVLLSTPFGKRGFFYQEWQEGGSSWHRAKITAYNCRASARSGWKLSGAPSGLGGSIKNTCACSWIRLTRCLQLRTLSGRLITQSNLCLGVKENEKLRQQAQG